MANKSNFIIIRPCVGMSFYAITRFAILNRDPNLCKQYLGFGKGGHGERAEREAITGV